jgi:hypothetical protein
MADSSDAYGIGADFGDNGGIAPAAPLPGDDGAEGDAHEQDQDNADAGALPGLAAPSPLRNVPTRDDVDFLRNSCQYTPSEINGYVDQHRPLLTAAGFSPDEIDGYYGIERLDWAAAARDVASRSEAAAVAPASPWQASLNPAHLILAAQSPELMSPVLTAQTARDAAGAARNYLIQSYKSGSCNSADEFRTVMLESLAEAGGEFDDNINGWLGRLLPEPTFDALSRKALVTNPVVNQMVRSSLVQKTLDTYSDMSPGGASALTAALLDHRMPDCGEIYDTATIAESAGRDGPGDRNTSFTRLGQTVSNVMDAYRDYGITPVQILSRGAEYPGLFKALTRDQADIRLFFPEETKFGPYGDGGSGIVAGPRVAIEDNKTPTSPAAEEFPADATSEDENMGGGLSPSYFTPQASGTKSVGAPIEEAADEGDEGFEPVMPAQINAPGISPVGGRPGMNLYLPLRGPSIIFANRNAGSGPVTYSDTLKDEEIKAIIDEYGDDPDALEGKLADNLISKTMKDGNEHYLGWNRSTDQITHYVMGLTDGFTMPKDLRDEQWDPENEYSNMHVHPYNTPLSPADIVTGARTGQESNAAYGVNGSVSRFRLTPQMASILEKMPDMERKNTIRELIADRATNSTLKESREILESAINSGKISNIDGWGVYNDILNRTLANYGVIDYEATHVYRPASENTGVAAGNVEYIDSTLYNQLQSSMNENIGAYISAEGWNK